MRYVEGNFLPQHEKDVLLFGKSGKLLEGEERYRLPHYAKVGQLSSQEQEKTKETYYIKTYQSTLFDPLGPYGRRERSLDTQVKKVSKNTFDNYLIYLKTNNSVYLTKAQRGFLND